MHDYAVDVCGLKSIPRIEKYAKFKWNGIEGIDQSKGIYYPHYPNRFGDMIKLYDLEITPLKSYKCHNKKSIHSKRGIKVLFVVKKGNNAKKIVYNTSNGEKIKVIDLASKLGVNVTNHYKENGKFVIEYEGLITTIQQGVFDNQKITEITIPDTLQVIDEYSFAGNELTHISIPENVTTINHRAFDENNLTEVLIPKNVTHLNPTAFELNKNLIKLEVDKQNKIYKSVNNCVIMDYKLICGCSSSIIPTEVKEIGQHAFDDVQFTNTDMIIPDNIVSIGNYSFSYSNIKTLTFNSNVRKINMYAFEKCGDLYAVTYNDNTYTSKSLLISALKNDGITLEKEETIFTGTKLDD